MNAFVRLTACIALVGLTLAGVESVCPAWAERFGLYWWTLPAYQRTIRDGNELSDRLDHLRSTLLARAEARHGLARDVAAGRRTLFEAAAAFRAMGEAPMSPEGMTLRMVPGASEGEKYCRRVITEVRVCLFDSSPSGADETVGRLEAELDGHIHAHGTVRLPASGP